MEHEYLCKQIAHLSGLPVRLYEGESLLFSFSMASFPVDPFDLHRKEVFEIKKHIGYYVTAHDTYYGVVNFGAFRIVMGPTSQIPLSEQAIREIAFHVAVKKEETVAFVAAMKKIAPLPLSSVVQYLGLINYIVNDGEKLSVMDVTIIDSEQNDLIKSIAEQSVQNAEEPSGAYPHNTLDMEEYMLSLVRTGRVAELNSFFESAPAIRGGIIAQSDLRQTKNLLVVTATLVSRAAIGGGMGHEEALSISDSYIRKAEMLTSIEEITNLNYRLVMDYAERMQRLRYGQNPTKLVTEVTNYIFKHLSAPITVSDLARALCRGRSRISTDFKKQTGENLSDYIQKRKIEESKRLLRYAGRPAVDVALYLGFSSQSHFSRVFKKYVGLTPNEFRNRE